MDAIDSVPDTFDQRPPARGEDLELARVGILVARAGDRELEHVEARLDAAELALGLDHRLELGADLFRDAVRLVEREQRQPQPANAFSVRHNRTLRRRTRSLHPSRSRTPRPARTPPRIRRSGMSARSRSRARHSGS